MAWLGRQPGWAVASQVSFAFARELGVVELLRTLDRKERLAARVAHERGSAVACDPRSRRGFLIKPSREER